MLFRKYLICIFLLIPFTSFADQYRAKVIKVIDGDTIWVKSKNKHIKIRLSYIDAPELKQVYGVRSKNFLSKLILKISSLEVLSIAGILIWDSRYSLKISIKIV